MSHSHKIDDIDKKILEILQARAKITNARLSEEIGLSPAPTLERVKKRVSLLFEHCLEMRSFHRLETDACF